MTKSQEKKLFSILIIILTFLIIYRVLTAETPRTQPLRYAPGLKVTAPLRQGRTASGREQDPVSIVLARHVERYPGVIRDLFHLQGDGIVRKKIVVPVVKTLPTPTTIMTPSIPQKTPTEIASDNAREDLLSFRFLGYLTDKDKDSSLFLSKDGELFIAKTGDRLLKNYKVKESGKDFVILLDTETKVEVRIELTGSGEEIPRSSSPALRR